MLSLRTALATLACVQLLLTAVGAVLISSSQVQQCINDGSSTSAASLYCTKMIVVTLVVNAGQNQTEAISATLRGIIFFIEFVCFARLFIRSAGLSAAARLQRLWTLTASSNRSPRRIASR